MTKRILTKGVNRIFPAVVCGDAPVTVVMATLHLPEVGIPPLATSVLFETLFFGSTILEPNL